MNEKILVNQNKSKCAEFENSVQKSVKKLNELIEQFHKYQSWQKIETESDFLKLIADPVAYFDQVMISNSGITTSSKLNPEVVAQLLNVSRDSWLEYVNAMSTASSMDYDKDYMIFRDCKLHPDEAAILQKKQSFAVYAESPGQIKLVLVFRDLVDTLNWLQAENICNSTEIENAATALRLFYSRDMGGKVLPMDELQLTNLIFGR